MPISQILLVLTNIFGPVRLTRSQRVYSLSAGNLEWMGTSIRSVFQNALLEAQGVKPQVGEA